MLDEERVRVVLPGAGDMPQGWEKSGSLRLHGAEPKEGLLALGTQGYAASDLEGTVGFGVQSFQTPAGAIARYTMKKSQMSTARVGPAQIPGVDAAFTASYCMGGNYCSTSINVRVGPVYAYVNINTDGPAAADFRILNSATRMLVQRIQQAQQGQAPTAKAV
ncbi:hypothetical protein [Streptomyces lavendulocolor]|uniref:hypothetical protein n=1 Tax=Streptomyces lavendulocolor TaxID=67316 RepID=UPI003C30AE3E